MGASRRIFLDHLPDKGLAEVEGLLLSVPLQPLDFSVRNAGLHHPHFTEENSEAERCLK